MEMGQLGYAALAMTERALEPVLTGSEEDLAALEAMDEEIDEPHGALITYLARLSLEPLTKQQSERLSADIGIVNNFEAIGDLIETNLVSAGRSRLAQQVEFSEATRNVLAALHARVQWAVKTASQAVASEDAALAGEVVAAKASVNQLAEAAEAHLAQRLVADEPNRLGAFRIESDLVENLKRIYYFAKRASRLVSGNARPAREPASADVEASPSPP
jgi:phosphate:Na+ symporter